MSALSPPRPRQKPLRPLARIGAPGSPLLPGALALVLALGLVAGCTPSASPTAPAERRLSADPTVHRLLRLAEVVRPELRQRLSDRGVTLLLRRGGGVWLARGPLAAFDGLAGHHGVVSVRRPAAAEKIAPRLAEALAREPGQTHTVWVLLAPEPEPGAASRWLPQIARAAGEAAPQRVAFAPLYALALDAARAQAVAELDPVRWLAPKPGPAIPHLDRSRLAIGADALHQIDTSTTPPRYALGGQGTVGGVWDPQGVDSKTEDVSDNLVRTPAPEVTSSLYHGTAVSSCMAGSGRRSAAPPKHPFGPYQLRGIAPEAKVAQYVTQNERDAAGTPTTFVEQYREARTIYKIDVVNFSFSMGYRGDYTTSAMNLDYLIQRGGESAALPAPVPFCLSAGNEGGRDGYASVSGFASAKNVLTVGSSDWPEGTLSTFSSMGPVKDGRLKPELTAPGCSSHGKTKIGLGRVRLRAADGAVVKAWDFAEGDGGWTVVRHLDKLVLSGGQLTATTTGHDPGVKSPDKLGLNTADIATVEFTLAASAHHRAEVFWKTDKGDFHGKRRAETLINADGTLRSYTIDLSGHKEWKDTLEQLRIDPITTGMALAVPGNTYSTSCGTSMSSPVTAGAVLLLTQAWRGLYPAGALRPSPALTKALLVATARDMVGQGPGKNPDTGALTVYGTGPDFASGYGEIQIDRAVKLLQSAATGPAPFVEGTVPRGGARFRVRLTLAEPLPSGDLSLTLAWDDPPGEPGAAAALQNDLDLLVETPAGGELKPWVLDPKAPTQPATRGVDRLNNLEQVSIQKPLAGSYLVTVSGHQLARPPQRFALVLSQAEGLTKLELDGDGDGAYRGTDCDDTDPTVHPAASEKPKNGKDDDCDSSTPDQPQDGGPLPGADGAVEAGTDAGAEAGPTPTVAGGGGCSGCTAAGNPRSSGAAGALSLLLLLLLGALRAHRRPKRSL